LRELSAELRITEADAAIVEKTVMGGPKEVIARRDLRAFSWDGSVRLIAIVLFAFSSIGAGLFTWVLLTNGASMPVLAVLAGASAAISAAALWPAIKFDYSRMTYFSLTAAMLGVITVASSFNSPTWSIVGFGYLAAVTSLFAIAVLTKYQSWLIRTSRPETA
jgi:hypothetical protein